MWQEAVKGRGNLTKDWSGALLSGVAAHLHCASLLCSYVAQTQIPRPQTLLIVWFWPYMWSIYSSIIYFGRNRTYLLFHKAIHPWWPCLQEVMRQGYLSIPSFPSAVCQKMIEVLGEMDCDAAKRRICYENLLESSILQCWNREAQIIIGRIWNREGSQSQNCYKSQLKHGAKLERENDWAMQLFFWFFFLWWVRENYLQLNIKWLALRTIEQ